MNFPYDEKSKFFFLLLNDLERVKMTFEVIFMHFKFLCYAKILKTDLKYSKLDH